MIMVVVCFDWVASC